jgi:large subunit ribosomal protein L13
LGKVAAEVSVLLTGKNKPNFSPNINVGDKVVVINAEKVAVSGSKLKRKVYHRVTGYPGTVKSETLEKLLSRKPPEAIRKAVYGMLPKNKLRKKRMGNLYVYQGTEHPHQAQIGK